MDDPLHQRLEQARLELLGLFRYILTEGDRIKAAAVEAVVAALEEKP